MTIYASLSNDDDELSLTSDYHDSDKIERGSVCPSVGKNSPKVGKGKLLQQAASVVKNRVGTNATYFNREGSNVDARDGSMSQPLAISTTLDNDKDEGGEGNSNDPYFVVRDDLLRQLSLAEESVAAYTDVVQKTDSAANSHEVKEKRKVHKRHLKHAESTINDLQSTINAVEANREQFAAIISDEQLQKRKQFVYDMKERIHSIKERSNSDKIKEKISQDERALTERRKAQQSSKKGKADDQTANMRQEGASKRESTSSLLPQKDDSSAHDEETAQQQMQAQEMLKQQDATLDDLDHAVVRVGQMAGNIHDELQSQNKMLTDMEEDLTDAEEKLGMVMGKLAKLMKTKNKCQLGTILILSVTVIILFFLVLYT